MSRRIVSIFVILLVFFCMLTLFNSCKRLALREIVEQKVAAANALDQVQTPKFNPGEGNYSNDQNVVIFSDTAGATIYYTTDSSTPTAGSSVYSSPISVSGHGTAMTIKALATKAGMEDSVIATANYSINYDQVSTPSFNPIGGNYSTDQSVEITTTTAGATIYYTTDGSDPDSGDSEYTTPITIADHGTSMTLKAIAVKSGMLDSTIASASYTIQYEQVATPTFTPGGGTYPGTQSVTISTTTSGATIHYTTNGSTPTTGSPVYSVPISVGADMTIRALAVKAMMLDSAVASATYTIIPPPNTPTGLSAQTVSSSQINLSWTDNSDNETGFKIERKTGAVGSFTQIDIVTANTTGYNDTGLVPETSYYYRIRAYNAGGDSGYSNEANDQTLPRWSIQTVDSIGDVGQYTSLALDTSGSPHIAYYDYTTANRDLKYAKWNGSSWDIATVDTTGYAGYGGIALDLDSSNYPHIAYYDGQYNDLKYAEWTGSIWSKQTIESTGLIGDNLSMVLDSSGNAHISCRDWTNYTSGYYELKYFKWNGSILDMDVVDSGGKVGGSTSIALDSSNRPHISYKDYDNNDLKYAKWNGSSWDIEFVDSTDDVGSYTSIALDNSNHAHISYRYYKDIDNKYLKYATWNGTSWQIEEIADSTVGGTSLALDASGNPHIAFHHIQGGSSTYDLKYARWTGSEWEVETADSSGMTGSYPSLVLDGNGHAHISYNDITNDDLKYAEHNP